MGNPWLSTVRKLVGEYQNGTKFQKRNVNSYYSAELIEMCSRKHIENVYSECVTKPSVL